MLIDTPARPAVSRPHRSRDRILTAILIAATLLIGGVLAIARAPRSAAASGQAVSDVSLAWSLNDTASAGAYYGGCNFLSAGIAGDHGKSAVWTQTAPSPGYATRAGNVTISKPDTAGGYAQPSWATKCTGPDNTTPVTTATASKSRVEFTGGTGTIDRSAGTATLHWTGSFTSVFYGGLSYWSASNPTLAVAADGTGTLTATLSGYGADMNDPTKWVAIAPITATLATLTGVAVGQTGFTATPSYRGVAVATASGDTPQLQAGTSWGSFPQPFIDFQHQTGESAYWYSSGLNDDDKPATPITVGYPAVPAGDGSSTPATATSPPATSSPATSSPATSRPPNSPPSYTPTLTVDQSSVPAGGTFSFTAVGFAPGETVDVVVHSTPLALTALVANSAGGVSGRDVLPATVPAGAHQLVLTGRASHATVQRAFTVTAAAPCDLTNGVKGGGLTWGFKKSFRSYVAGPASNSITATSGASILNQDLAVAGKTSSGSFRWPFVSSSGYTSPSAFTVQFGGKIEFKYPAHYFAVWIANPKLVVTGTTGILYADVSLTASQPGQPPNTTAHPGEQLATIDLSGTSPVSGARGITRILHTAIADVNSFSFNGSAFYTRGEPLDDATVLLSGCAGSTVPAGVNGPDPIRISSATNGIGSSGNPNLVPLLSYRPTGALASTGDNIHAPLVLAALLVILGAGLVLSCRSRHFHLLRKGIQQ